MLAWSAVDHGFDSRSGQTKDYEIGICCFSTKHAALRRKSNDWLARNQNNVSQWSDMYIRGLLFQWFSTKRTSSSSQWKLTCSRHDVAEQFALNSNKILTVPWFYLASLFYLYIFNNNFQFCLRHTCMFVFCEFNFTNIIAVFDLSNTSSLMSVI